MKHPCLALGKLVEAGFDPVYRLQGNFGGWVEAGFPVSTLTVEEETLLNDAASMGVRTEAGFIDITPEQVKALIRRHSQPCDCGRFPRSITTAICPAL